MNLFTIVISNGQGAILANPQFGFPDGATATTFVQSNWQILQSMYGAATINCYPPGQKPPAPPVATWVIAYTLQQTL